MGRVVYKGSRHRTQRRRSTVTRESWHVGPSAFRFVVIAAVAVLLSMYVRTNVKTSQGEATLRALTEQKNALSDQLQDYTIQSARAGNIQATKDGAEKLGMQQVSGDVKTISTQKN